MTSQFKTFFEDSPLALKAAHSIKDGKEIALTIVSKNAEHSEEHLTFVKIKGQNRIEERQSRRADLTFIIPHASALDLVTQEFDTVGQVGLFIFDRIITDDSTQKIQVKLNCGVLSLMTGGYLGILGAGGTEVAQYLATKGLGSLGKIKETISKLKGTSP